MLKSIFYAVVIVASFFCHAAMAKETRVALVIGNAAYNHAGTLANPRNDARAIATMIGKMGFDSIDVAFDRDRDSFRHELSKFIAKANDADLALVYFAGHGIEIAGVNYLLPTDARLTHEDDVRDEAVPLDEVLQAVRAARKLRVVILDACRNNPFAGRILRRDGATSSLSTGLAPVDTAGEVLVAYAAKHGTTASDGGSENSPYAEALLRHLPTPGLDIRLMFGHVRDSVLQATGQGQEPYIYGSVGGQQIYFTRSEIPPEPPSFRKERWVPSNGPFAGAPDAIALDPNFSDIMFAVADGGRLHRSLDEGRTWAQLGDPVPGGVKLSAVGSLGGNQYLLFAGTTGALFVRRSDVSPWEKVQYFEKLGDANVRAVATSARQPGLVYAASGAQTIRVTASSTVAMVATGTAPQEGRPVKIAWRDEVFEGGNIHRSLDGGRTWSTGGLPISNAIAIAAGNPNIVVAATSDEGVFTTIDGGLNWRHFNCLGRRYVSQQVAISPDDPMVAAIATNRGAFFLDLSKEPHCRRIGLFEDTNAVAFSRKDRRRLLIGTDDGVFESRDGGATFQDYSEGLVLKRILGLQVTEAETVVARVDGIGIASRAPQEPAWIQSMASFGRAGIGALAFDSAGNLYAGTVSGPLVSENLGSTFRWLLDTGSEVMAISTFPRDTVRINGRPLSWSPTGNLLVGTQKGGIFLSGDSGGTWQRTHDGKDTIWAFAIDSVQRQVLAAAGKAGILVSRDSGRTWIAANDGLADVLVASVAVAPGAQPRVYAGTSDGRVFFTDGDKLTWRPVSTGLPGKPILALAHERSTPSRIWAATEGAGVFSLEEGAAAWVARNEGLDTLNTIALAIDPIEPSHVYVSGHTGVHVSRNGGTWAPVAEGLRSIVSINAIAMSPKGEMLFAGENNGLYGVQLR